MKILIVEDDDSIRRVISGYLLAEGYEIYQSADGAEGLALAQELSPDIVVLDVNLPHIDGFTVASTLRQKSNVYILLLTARGEEEDRIKGLTIGADDYVVKPFSPRELVARINAVARRLKQTKQVEELNNCLPFQLVTVCIDQYEAVTPNGILDLTPTEFQLLYELALHAGQVLTRNQLLDRVWGESFAGNDRVVDVYVGQVRRKLEEATGEQLIRTIRGVGYRFVAIKK